MSMQNLCKPWVIKVDTLTLSSWHLWLWQTAAGFFCCSQESPQIACIWFTCSCGSTCNPGYFCQLPTVLSRCSTSKATSLHGLYSLVTVTGGHCPVNSSTKPNLLALMLPIHRVNTPSKMVGYVFLVRLVLLPDWYDFTCKCAQVLHLLSFRDKK